MTTISTEMYQDITFISMKKVVWNYEKQVSELKNVLKYDRTCGLHCTWLNEAVSEYHSNNIIKNRSLQGLFLTCDPNSFSFYEEKLIEVLELLETLHEDK